MLPLVCSRLAASRAKSSMTPSPQMATRNSSGSAALINIFRVGLISLPAGKYLPQRPVVSCAFLHDDKRLGVSSSAGWNPINFGGQDNGAGEVEYGER